MTELCALNPELLDHIKTFTNQTADPPAPAPEKVTVDLTFPEPEPLVVTDNNYSISPYKSLTSPLSNNHISAVFPFFFFFVSSTTILLFKILKEKPFDTFLDEKESLLQTIKITNAMISLLFRSTRVDCAHPGFLARPPVCTRTALFVCFLACHVL